MPICSNPRASAIALGVQFVEGVVTITDAPLLIAAEWLGDGQRVWLRLGHRRQRGSYI